MSAIDEIIKFYRAVISDEFINSTQAGLGISRRNSVYNSALVVWLIIFQRLQSDKTLLAAITQLRRGQGAELLSESSSKARAKKISGSTGGYSQARQRESYQLVEQVAERITKAINDRHKSSTKYGMKIYIIDGSTFKISHSSANIKTYAQYYNNYGKSHYPLGRILVATNALTGVCERPSYAPYIGEEAVSEISLSEDLLPRLEKGSLVIGDRYFGCCRFADTAIKNGLEVLCRLKERDVKQFKGSLQGASGEISIDWQSKLSKTGVHHSAKGRLIWHTLRKKGFRPMQLILFTTLSLPIKNIVELYGLRWNVELDLRDIKSTLEMDFIDAKSPDMVSKEIVLGIVAYNLIRHFMYANAKKLKVTVRELSFSHSLKRIIALASANLSQDNIPFINRLLADSQSLKLPSRKKKRPNEPRKSWPRGQVSFLTTSREHERKKINPDYSSCNINKV